MSTSNRFLTWRPPVVEHGKLTEWNWMVQHPQNLVLGAGSDIGAFTYINAENGVVIEDEVQIGSHCAIYSASTIDDKSAPVVLKRNCRIGSHSTVMPGVTIGENAIVGAHSFVNTDIPNDVLAFGCPARIIRPLNS
jgi:acetyltransferase-like isoleucine patch superfamily enzyme